ncbi:Nuf2 family-domain-containing protein [Multifurca ochricompacta]|uniref:Nuf2 family-domain-containing protein n=1 Tax=Multifurca ochricompacta TaxID=376703 RepID=A0AAD4QNC5_9AGAM|nr:Nuf2 family-domain-containing protein [Multifurca ochricompacta]
MNQLDKNIKQYWYPNMGNADIVDSLDGWGLSVTHQQLVKPTPEFVLSVYSACLQQVVGLTEDLLQDPVQSALFSLDDPSMDIYGPAIGTNLLVYHIIRLADAAKVPDFSGKDIFTPTSERTRLILSAFINFVKFSEQCMPFVAKLRGKAADLIQERESVAHERARLESQLAKLKAKRAEDEPRLDGIRKENASITSQLIAYKDTQTRLLKDIESLKAEKSTLVQRKEGLYSDAALATDGVSRVRSRVVQSPERIRRTINAMGNTANEDKKTYISQQTTIDELQTKVSALLNIEKDFRTSVEQLQTLEKEMHALEAAEKMLSDSRDSHEQQKNEQKGSLLRVEHLGKQLANARERIERAQRHVEDKRIASRQAIERLEKEYQNMAIERRDNDKHNEELRAEADEIERKMADHLKRSEAELGELLAEYWALRNRTSAYMETIAKKLGMQVSSIEVALAAVFFRPLTHGLAVSGS